MSDRTYRLIFGALLLLSLYFDLYYLIYALIGILLFEGITKWRLSLLAQKLRGTSITIAETEKNSLDLQRGYRFNFEAERVWRLLVASILLITFALFYNQLWFFPWFMGFAIFGAGASGVCPMLTGIKWAGFK